MQKTLSEQVEEFLKNKAAQEIDRDHSEKLPSGYITLPMGYTKFPDGNLPRDRKQSQPLSEAERNAKIEAVNAGVRKARGPKPKLTAEEKIQAKREKTANRLIERKDQIREQIVIIGEFFTKATHGDLNKLCLLSQTSVKTIRNSKTGATLLGKERWKGVKEIIANFKYGEKLSASELNKSLNPPKTSRKKTEKTRSPETIRRAEVLRLGKLAKEQGVKIFTAPCAKHGMTTYKLYNGFSRCLECRFGMNKAYIDERLDSFQKDRRERAVYNNDQMHKALEKGSRIFEGLCTHCGYTEFRAHKVEKRNKFEYRCRNCAIAAHNKDKAA